jgi:hypothetical protein
MRQQDIIIALDRIERLAKIRQVSLNAELRELLYLQLDEGAQMLLAQVPPDFQETRFMLTVISRQIIEHRPSAIVDTLFPLFAVVIGGEREGRILHEVQWHLLERRPKLEPPALYAVTSGLS